jgi:hypothetical protein
MADSFQKFDLSDFSDKAVLLTVELVPSTAWGKNLRSELAPKDWDKLRKQTYADAGHHCEVCGGQGRNHPVECHEIWQYDDRKRIQKLIRLIALCPDCHQVKHFGLAQIQGKEKQALAHLMKVNGWTEREAREHIRDAARLWNERSENEWTLDLSWLESQGVAVP